MCAMRFLVRGRGSCSDSGSCLGTRPFPVPWLFGDVLSVIVKAELGSYETENPSQGRVGGSRGIAGTCQAVRFYGPPEENRKVLCVRSGDRDGRRGRNTLLGLPALKN